MKKLLKINFRSDFRGKSVSPAVGFADNPPVMPPELALYLPWIAAVAGLLVGSVATSLILAVRHGKAAATLRERLRGTERRAVELETRVAHTEEVRDQFRRDAVDLRTLVAELQANLDNETKASIEKQALLEKAEQKLADTFKALSADALKANAEQFLQLARTSLRATAEEAKGDLEARRQAVEQLVKPVAESLEKVQSRIGEIEKTRADAYGELREHIRAMRETQSDLRHETSQLVKALRQPSGRGQWGELQLRRVVELAGMQERCDFDLQVSSTDDEGRRLRPDMIVRLPGGKTIVVDSKTPMDAYLDALEAPDDATRRDALARHARQVRTHIAQLGAKNYAARFEPTPEFVVLFLPSESFFSAALQEDPGLIERGVDTGVILATPTTLIALLRAVAYGWRQEALAENAREISELGRELYKRLATLGSHFLKLGKSLDRSVQTYNDTLASFESRVLPAARRFEQLKAAPENATLPEPAPVEKIPRPPMQTIEATADEAENEAERQPDEPEKSDESDMSGSPVVTAPDSAARAAADDLRAALGE